MGFARFIHLWLWGALRRSVGLGDFIAGIAGNIVTVILHFYPAYEAAMKDLLWQIPIYGLAGAMAWRLMIVPYELWKEAMATPASNVAEDAEREYQLERAKQRAILEAESERSRRNNPYAQKLLNPTLGDAAEKIYKNQMAEEETERALAQENRLALQKRRRSMIAECRDLAHRFTVKSPMEPFRGFLEEQRVYADIRSHLSPDYLKKLNAGRTTYSNADGARYPALVGWFFDELDRLEKEWGL